MYSALRGQELCVGLANGDSFVELFHKLLSGLGFVFFQHIPPFGFVVGTPLLPKRWRLFGLLRRNQKAGARGREQSWESQGMQTCGLMIKME